MGVIIYALGTNPEKMLKSIEGEVVTLNESEALRFDSQSDADAVIDTLNGTTDFWGTRKPRPRGN